MILVDPAGRSVIGGNAVDDVTLDGLFRMSFDDDHDTSIIVEASPAAPQRAVSKVLERAKAAGLQRVSARAGTVP